MKKFDLSNTDDVYQLIESCKEGKTIAQRVLYEEMSGKMLSLCYRYVSDIDEARDLMHDGMIKVFENLKKYQFSGSFEGWARRIILNNLLDYLRRKKNMYYSDNLDNTNGENVTNEHKMDDDFNKMKADILLKLVKNLPQAYKVVFNLYVIEDFSHREVAEFLGISENTSKSNLSKAKIKLRKMYYEISGEKELI